VWEALRDVVTVGDTDGGDGLSVSVMERVRLSVKLGETRGVTEGLPEREVLPEKDSVRV